MKRPTRSTAHSKTTQTTEEELDSGESDCSSDPSVDAAKGAVTEHPRPTTILESLHKVFQARHTATIAVTSRVGKSRLLFVKSRPPAFTGFNRLLLAFTGFNQQPVTAFCYYAKYIII